LNAADHSALEILTVTTLPPVHSGAFTCARTPRRRDLQACRGVTVIVIVRRYSGEPRQDPSEPFGLISKL
jgi:hypothetical protein